MRWWHILRQSWRSLRHRSQVDRELEEELQFHLQRQIERNVAAGMAPDEAESDARRSFGGLTQRREECREARRTAMLEELLQDFTYAVRGLRRDPALAFTTAAILAVCIGANSTMFSLVNSILVKPLPYPGSERIYWIAETMGRNPMEVALGGDYYSLRELNRTFEDVAAFDQSTLNWSGSEKPEQVDAASVSASFFRVMGAQPVVGRVFAANEEGTKSPPVVVVSYPFWRSRLASDRNAAGKTIILDGLTYTIVGVMPQGFDYPSGTQIWRPLDLDESSQRPRLENRPIRLLRILARAKPGVNDAQLETEMRRLTHEIREEYPKSFQKSGFLENMRIFAKPLQEYMAGNLRPALLALSGAVALVLLIACANLANLLLARSMAREREIAVRLAIGAGRGRVVRQLLVESLTLALPGGVIGVLIASMAVTALNVTKPLVLEHYPPLSMDTATLAFTLAITVCTGIVFGMVPAFSAVRVSVQESLKMSGPAQSGGKSAMQVRRLLIVAELALSLVLLIGAGLLGRSFLNLAHQDLGFPASNLLTMRVNLVGSQHATGAGQLEYYRQVLERLRQLPMVRSAAVATDVPLSGGHPYMGFAFQIGGRPALPMRDRPQASMNIVSPEYFSTLGIPLKQGRLFGAQDTPEAADSVIVNETFVKRNLANENALGKLIVEGPNDTVHWRIAGVVGDVRGTALGVEPEPLVYRCTCEMGTSNRFLTRMSVIVRTWGDPRGAVAVVEGQLYAVDRKQPVFDVKTMQERQDQAMAPQRFELFLIGTFAVIAVVLAAFGIYG
ncbi:MAG: ABC transporter permease, partial [Acidobacteriaceae bacterium]|nr:ABC transporter permease [Acidobacteriaceae bacterium]